MALEFATKFNAFDVNADGVIDFFELKLAQEKLGKPKTHKELTELMESMATDPSRGITFKDFVRVQAQVSQLSWQLTPSVGSLFQLAAEETG